MLCQRKMKRAMKRRHKILVSLGMVLCFLIWRAWPMVGIFTGSNLQASEDPRLLGDLVPPRTESVVSYAGFSHPYWHTERLCFEILLKPRRMIHGHAFSRAATETEAIRKIADLLSNPSSFRQWTGNKACGGFHADRYFGWTKDSQRWEVLLCMGCHEALLFHGGKFQEQMARNQSYPASDSAMAWSGRLLMWADQMRKASPNHSDAAQPR